MAHRTERDPEGFRCVFGGGLAVVFIACGLSFSQSTPCIPQTKLLPSSGSPEDHCGFSLAASGDTVIVGAPRDDASASGYGFASVFVRGGTGWVEQDTLTASDGDSLDAFGCAVGVSGDTAVVGALHHDVTGPSSGAAYVFVRQGASWSEEA